MVILYCLDSYREDTFAVKVYVWQLTGRKLYPVTVAVTQLLVLCGHIKDYKLLR